MPNPNRQRSLILGLLLSIGSGVAVTMVGFIGTLVYLLTTGHLHAADRSAGSLYLIAPVLGVSIAIIGCGITVLNWVKSRPGAGQKQNARN